jgi:putative oxidoreductase
MRCCIQPWANFSRHLEEIGGYIPQLGLRLFLAYEFWLAGVEKYSGTNWFADIQSEFPFPFNLIAPEISWQLATWFELIGAAALVLGLATRFFSLSLIVLTIVAWAAVHAGNGYNVCDNGYKLPLMYLLMFIPLLFNGAGKASMDHFIWKRISLGS